jgi:isoleucyl-tRNA synthetase
VISILIELADYLQKSEKKGKAKKEASEEEGGKYSKTVNLPLTKFDQRANSVVREPEIQKFWDDEKIYDKIYESNKGSKFVLHDGPPYANGDLHIGIAT